MSLSSIIISKNSNNIHQKKDIFKILEDLKNMIKELKSLMPNNIAHEIDEKINGYFIKIKEFIYSIKEITNANNIQNESLRRKDEQSIRILYTKIFNQKLVNEVLENKIFILNKKEKEYELLKQKTGAIVCNGQVICNERKDNEIIILRTENSLLKTTIKNKEDLLKEKNEMITSLNNDILLYKNQIDELRKEKHRKYSSFSNINININETKKDFNQKNNKSNKYSLNSNKTINFFPSTKNNIIKNTKYSNNKENNNSINNIYSSYQMNSQLINRINNSKNKNKLNCKEEFIRNTNISKINNKNETIDSLNNKTYSIKYISVNKSLFSPKNNNNSNKSKITYNNSSNNINKKTLQINRKKKSKYTLNQNITNKEFNTITIAPKHNNKEVGAKKSIINNRVIIGHRKSNSIQWPENSIKNLIKDKYEKNLSIENENNCSHVYSAIRKLNKIKNQTLKNNNSPTSSILNNISDVFEKNNQTYSQKYLANFLMPYSDKRNDNRGRNDNARIGDEYIKDNTLSFFQKTFIYGTSYGENNGTEKNFSNIYNNSIEIYRDINNHLNK